MLIDYLLKNLKESTHEMYAKVCGMHAKVSYGSTIQACRPGVVTSPQVDSPNYHNGSIKEGTGCVLLFRKAKKLIMHWRKGAQRAEAKFVRLGELDIPGHQH